MKKFKLHKEFAPINMPNEQQPELRAIRNLYSYYRGMMPARYSRQYLLNLGEEDKNIKNLVEIRAISEKNKYDNASLTSDATKFISNDLQYTYNNIEDDNVKSEIANYIKEQTVNFGYNNIKRYYLKMNAFYADIIAPLNRQLNTEATVSVDLLAQKVDYALRNDFERFINEVRRQNSAKSKELEKTVLCGVREVYDSLTKKTYRAVVEISVPEDCREETPEGREKLNRFIMANALEPNGKVVILGEVGGKVNPFSHMPVDYKGATLITNVNIAPESAPVFFVNKAYNEMQAMVLEDRNFLKYIQLSYAMEIEHNAYKHILRAVNQIVGDEPLDCDLKKIEKITKPNFLGKVFSKSQNRADKVKDYINGKRTQNFGIIYSAKKVADEFEKRANEKKCSVESPFPELDF